MVGSGGSLFLAGAADKVWGRRGIEIGWVG